MIAVLKYNFEVGVFKIPIRCPKYFNGYSFGKKLQIKQVTLVRLQVIRRNRNADRQTQGHDNLTGLFYCKETVTEATHSLEQIFFFHYLWNRNLNNNFKVVDVNLF
jgi:hypothetical protein